MAGTTTTPVGANVILTGGFDSTGLNATAYGDLVGGTFPVLLNGTATSTFAGSSDTADLVVTFGFVAYK